MRGVVRLPPLIICFGFFHIFIDADASCSHWTKLENGLARIDCLVFVLEVLFSL